MIAGESVRHGQMKVEVELRGAGAAEEKSAELLLVSVQPLLPLNAAVVLVSADSTVPSKQVAVP